jgi:hypothetical protein
MLLKCFKKFATIFMELIYVKKVHGYFEIFQKILNSQIVSKIAKSIRKIKLEKTFEKKGFPFLSPSWAIPSPAEAQPRPA